MDPAEREPTTYVVEAGSAPGLTNLANTATGSATPAFAATAVSPGNYFLRVRNAAGTSSPSSEVIVTVGVLCQLPAAPQGLTSTVVCTSVTLEWTGAGGSFQLEAGSGPARGPLQRRRGRGDHRDAGGAPRLLFRARPGAQRVWLRPRA